MSVHVQISLSAPGCRSLTMGKITWKPLAGFGSRIAFSSGRISADGGGADDEQPATRAIAMSVRRMAEPPGVRRECPTRTQWGQSCARANWFDQCADC